MEAISYDLKDIINEMSEAEKNIYFNENSSKYFKYLHGTKKFEIIMSKLDNEYIIREDEWLFLFKRFFAITCKAIEENEKISFLDRIIFMFSKIGCYLSKIDSKTYNECFKMIRYIESIKMNKEINSDLMMGLEIVGRTRDYNNLNILLKQHMEASDYRDYKDMFFEEYKKSNNSHITYDEGIAIKSFGKAYIREKDLVKKYK